MLNWFRFVSLLALLLIFTENQDNPTLSSHDRRAVAQSTPTFNTVVYWGQNRLGQNQYSGQATKQEPSLANLCRLSKHKIVILNGIRTLFSTRGMPGMDFSTHCRQPFYSESQQDQAFLNRQKFVLLSCPSIGNDIKYCQSLGKKVLLSISPQLDLSSDEEGVRLAQNIWNLFLGGSGDRPFGPGVKLDGVDMMIRANGVTGYTKFAETMRSLMSANYLLSGSPRCSFPDASFGPTWSTLPLAATPQSFDILFMHFMSSPDCSYLNEQFFRDTITKWVQWSSTLPKPLPFGIVFPGWPGYVDASATDYIPIETLTKQNLASVLKQHGKSQLWGVGVWEGSADYLNYPCKEDLKLPSSDRRSYADIWRMQLNADASQSGVNTPSSQACSELPSEQKSGPETIDGGGSGGGGGGKGGGINIKSESANDRLGSILLLVLSMGWITACLLVI